MGKSAPWQTLLARKNGKPGGAILATHSNAATVFAHTPEWRGVFAYDEFIGDIVTLREPPWPIDLRPDKTVVGQWTRLDTSLAASWLQRNDYGIMPSFIVGEGLHIVAARQTQHPVRDYLNGLKWDRKKRVDTFFHRVLKADDNPYVRAVCKNFFIGAVARILHPGAKVDTMPILEGEQGIGKSSAVRELMPDEAWFLENMTADIGSKDSYQLLRRKWIGEFGELDALGRIEVARVKQFLTQRVDTYRPSYGHGTADFPRQSVFIGTVNPHGTGYLKDETGARRFQPVLLRGRIDIPAVKSERNQLWAEAVFRYRRCEKWYIDDPRVLGLAKEEAEERRQSHPWELPVMRWLDTRKAIARSRGVTTHDVLEALDIPLERRTRADEMTVAGILRLAGWTDKYRDCKEPGRPWRFRRSGALREVDTDGDKRPNGHLNGALNGAAKSPAGRTRPNLRGLPGRFSERGENPNG